MEEFHYRLPFVARDPRPGHHRSSVSGAGLEFVGHVPLIAASDARRLDVRATLARPMQDWVVRRYRQRSVANVWLVADLSASIGFHGEHDKTETLARLAASIGFSAWRTGDRFGFVGCDESVRHDWFVAPTRQAAVATDTARRLRSARPRGSGAAGLLDATRHLGSQRGLVFLASDWHLPLEQMDRVLSGLARHEVVPLVLWDRRELDPGPGIGLVSVADPESGARRTLLMRPRLRARIVAAMAQRREDIESTCRKHGRRALFMLDGFHPDRLTSHFFGGGAR